MGHGLRRRFLAGKVIAEACFLNNAGCPNGQTSQTGPGAGAPCTGHPTCYHGTHVAGIAAGNGEGAGQAFSGVAKGASVVAIQVFQISGSSLTTAFSDVMAALEHVYSLKDTYQLASANMSLGTLSTKFTSPCDGDALKPIIDNLRSVGIASVVAAMNNGWVDGIGAPACVSTAISVGAVGKNDVVASFSNVSPHLSLFAPGVLINSAVPGGGYNAVGGTSMATPHVAGAWAVLKHSTPGKSVTDVLAALQSTGKPITDTRPGGTVTKPRIKVATAIDPAFPPDVTAPAVTITEPANGSSFSGGLITIKATATDDVGVLGVQFTINGPNADNANIDSEQFNAPYSVSFFPSADMSGTYTLTAIARDAAFNFTTSAPVTITIGSGSDTTPPAVTITSPTSGSTVSGSVAVTATASDNVGVASVQFKLDGANLGAPDTASPYSMTWDTAGVAPGSHTLTATAVDAAGNATTSAPVTVTVAGSGDTTPPTATITSPASGVWTGNSINVAASATDNVGLASIKLWGNGAVFATFPCSTTTCSGNVWWSTGPLPPAAYEVQAVATDKAGNTKTSAKIVIFKDATSPVKPSGAPQDSASPPPPDTTPPTVAITAPAGGSTVSGTVTVSATASANVGVANVQFKLDGANLGTPDTTAPYSTSWNTTTASAGTHTLTAVATDTSGNTTTSAPVTVTVSQGGADTTPPTATITSPASGTWTGNSINVAASVTDNVGLASIKLYGNGGVFATFTCSGATCSGNTWWSTGPLPPAAYEVQAVATDTSGNTKTSAKIVIYKDATSPVKISGAPPDGGSPPPAPPLGAHITSPLNGASVSGTVDVAMAADNAQGSPTQFVLKLDNATTLSSQSVSGAAASYLWNTATTTAGPHTLNLTVTDAAGRTATAAVSVTVQGSPDGTDTTPPTVAITSPPNGAWTGNSIDVTATASDNVGLATLKFYGNGTEFAQVSCGNATTCSGTEWWSTGLLPSGQHTITVVATDTAGNQKTSAPVVINK